MYTLKNCSGADLHSLKGEPKNITEDHGFRDSMHERKRDRVPSRRPVKVVQTPKKSLKTTPQRRARKTPEIAWLKNVICPFVYGEKTPDGIFPSVTKQTFIGRGNLSMGLPSLPNYKLNDHFQDQKTLYYFGNGSEQCKRTLVMIDIDVLKSKGLGSPAGARAFSAHLNSIWPNLYFEPSTNGKGMHGYFLLLKKGVGAGRTNAALKRLEKWLRAESSRIKADIEQVEVKGACLDITFEGRMVQSVQYGSFAKLPRDISRFDEWENTTALRVRDLESSLFDEDVAFQVDLNPLIPAVTVPTNARTIRTVKNSVASRSGSVSGMVISNEDLSCIPIFESLYREWVGPNDLMAGKFRVTAHDFAVAMVLLRHFKIDPNSDGSLPTRRVGELWTGLFSAGDVQRGWNHHRWKVIRDFLSEHGHIDWKEHRYEYETIVRDESGKKDLKKSKQGIACKWGISDAFSQHLTMVTNVSGDKTSFVDTKTFLFVPSQGGGQYLTPQPFPLRAENERVLWLQAYQAFENLCAA